MFAKLKSLFTRQNCKLLQAAIEEARELAMNHWERIGILSKENEDLKDRISEECNAVTLLIDKLETEKQERKLERRKISDDISDALSLSKLANIRQEINSKTSIATLRKKIEADRLALEAVQRVLDGINSKDPR